MGVCYGWLTGIGAKVTATVVKLLNSYLSFFAYGRWCTLLLADSTQSIELGCSTINGTTVPLYHRMSQISGLYLAHPTFFSGLHCCSCRKSSCSLSWRSAVFGVVAQSLLFPHSTYSPELIWGLLNWTCHSLLHVGTAGVCYWQLLER